MSITKTCKDKLNKICTDGLDDYGPFNCAQCMARNTIQIVQSCNPLSNDPSAVAAETLRSCGGGPDGCYETLNKSCAAQRDQPGMGCLVCAGQHQQDLEKAGCDSTMINYWCANPVDPKDAVICDRYLRMFVGDYNTYDVCMTKAKAETAAMGNIYCQGRSLDKWCTANSIDRCPDEDFCTNSAYGFKGTCEPCLNDGKPSTCGGGFP